MKQNCWEFMKCGKQAGAKLAAGEEPCAASTETRLDDVHGGKNAGRACWVVVGTMCGEAPTGKCALELEDCGTCRFYKMVRKDEPDFKFAVSLLNLRRKTFSLNPHYK
jgi:hypothetical protein